MLERLRVWLAVAMVGLMVAPVGAAAGAENAPAGRSDGSGPDISDDSFFEDFNYTDIYQLKAAGWTPSGLSVQTTGTGVRMDNDGSAGSHLKWIIWPSYMGNYSMEYRWRWVGRTYGTSDICAVERHGSPDTAVDFSANGQLACYIFGDNGIGTNFGSYVQQLNAWRTMRIQKLNNTFDMYMDTIKINSVSSPNNHVDLPIIELDIAVGFLSTIEVDYVRVVWEVQKSTAERKLSLTSNRYVYVPGDEVTLNANVKRVQWTWEQKASGPTARNFHAAVWDSQNNQMLVFGGNPTVALPHANDLWAYDPSTDSWTQKATATLAKGRVQHSAVWDSQNNQMLIFGGYDGNTRLNDLWAYSPSTDTWSQKAIGPSARYYHSAVWDDQNDQMLIFGGYDGSYKNDLWAYFPSNNTWLQKASGATRRDAHTAVWDSQNDQMLVFGGDDGSGTRVNDLWAYIPANDAWIQKGSGATPRWEHNAVWNPVDNQMLVFGGSGSVGALDDLWAYSSQTDSWAQKGTGATARTSASAVWDDQSKQMILFGGYGASSRLNDTWKYSASISASNVDWAWEKKTSAPFPPRGAGGAVWATNLNKMIVFGGAQNNPGLSRNDTWIYDPMTDTWTQKSSGPSPRSFFAYAWDPINNKMIIFGGDQGTGLGVIGDTWAYDPISNIWSKKSNGPWAGCRMATTMNPVTNEMYIYGGEKSGSINNELWAYNLTADQWSRKTDGPFISEFATFVTDPRTNSGILFGGRVAVSGNDASSYVASYDFKNDSWTTKNDAPVERCQHAAIWNTKTNKMLVFGGRPEAPIVQDSLLEYTPETDTWIQINAVSPWPSRRGAPMACWNPGDSEMIMTGGGIETGVDYNDTMVYKQVIKTHNISFQVDDPSAKPYFLMANKTNSAGNATVSFTLPLDAPEGTYNCSATANVSGTVLLATGWFRVVWPWSAVMTVTPFYSSVYHLPGDLIEILAYTGYRYAPADANKTAIGSNLTAAVSFPNGTAMMSVNNLTATTGWANMSFVIPNIDADGTYTVTITGFENKTWSGQFLARGIEGDIRLKTVTSPANVNRGAAFTISVVIENLRASYVNCLLVVQILDSNNVPLRPTIQKLNVTRSPGFLANVTITIDPKSPTGIYHVQVQLLTGLPKDRGYALDYRNGTILVQ